MKWYKRDPDAALAGMAELSFEECGAYNRLLDLLYSRDSNVPDDDAFCAMVFHCNPRTWRALKARLMVKGKIRITPEGRLTANRVQFELNSGIERIAKARRMRQKQLQNQQNFAADVPGQPHIESKSISLLPSSSLVYRDNTHCRIEADPTSLANSKKRKASKISYSAEFDAFWSAYPTTRNMSKKEAWDVWRRLALEDQALAVDAVPKYKQWLAGKGDRAPEVIHACRFLSKRRFEGHAQANGVTDQFYATFGSAELAAWDDYGRQTKRGTYPRDKRGGWHFPSQWPPDHHADE